MTSRRRKARLHPLFRVVCGVLLLLVTAQCSVAWALAWPAQSTTCCDGNDDEGQEQHDDDRPCSCPLDCSNGCTGSSTRAVAPADLVLVFGPAQAVPVSTPLPVTTPAETDSRDILHVPKR